MADLIAFLTARIGEDEAAAADATDGPWYADGTEIRGHNRAYAGGGPGVLVVKHTWPQESAHIIRHDPARSPREVAFKRAVLAEHRTAAGWSSDNWPLSLRLLADIWSDHPDYRPEWA